MGFQYKVLEWITNPLDRDGQSLYPVRLAARMRAVRVDFMTWRVNDPSLASQIEATGSELLVVPDRLSHPLRYVREASQLLRAKRYDAVHIHANSRTAAFELLAAKRADIPVRIVHSHNSSGGYPALHKCLTPLFNALYTGAFACSQEAGEWMFGKRPFALAHNAIDLNAFAYDETARRETRDAMGLSDAFVVGMVAENVPQKNHVFLLDAFQDARAKRSDLTLLLIGSGTEALPDVQGALRLGARADIAKWYSAMDALVLPSIYEGLPTVVLEAQCAGLPVLLSDSISRACAASDAVSFLPLTKEVWRDALSVMTSTDRRRASAAAITALKERGYDLIDAARAMEQYYLKEIQR